MPTPSSTFPVRALVLALLCLLASLPAQAARPLEPLSDAEVRRLAEHWVVLNPLQRRVLLTEMRVRALAARRAAAARADASGSGVRVRVERRFGWRVQRSDGSVLVVEQRQQLVQRGAPEGLPEGSPDGAPQGMPQGLPRGLPAGTRDNLPDGADPRLPGNPPQGLGLSAPTPNGPRVVDVAAGFGTGFEQRHQEQEATDPAADPPPGREVAAP